MPRRRYWICSLLAACAPVTYALNGSQFAIESSGSASGSAWNLTGTGYLGTYITVPNGGGTVSFDLNANEGAGTGTPHVNLVVADTSLGFDLTNTSSTDYTGSTFLPGGTYFVRTERNYTSPQTVSTRSATINSLSVSGATIDNVNDGTTALAASDSYIANFRQGAATVALTGPGNIPLLAGTAVNTDLKRIAFNFGTAVPGSSPNGVGSYLGSGGTTQQTQYQAHLNQDFNAVVPENMGKWGNDESTQGNTSNMSGVDTILNYAQTNHMQARMHNLIWGNQQPGFVQTALNAGTTSAATLSSDITSRIGYFVGTGTASDRAKKYTQLDVYNESYHTGSTQANSYWNDMGVGSIAQIYSQVHAVAPNVALYMNEYNIYEDGADKYANWYQQHIESLRNAGYNGGLGNVLGGIGTQYYPDDPTASGNASTLSNPNSISGSANDPARVMQTLQNLSTEGLPITLTEFGVKPPGATGAGASAMNTGTTTENAAASILSDTLRMVFGNPNADGFMMWGFQAEGNGTTFGTNLFQSESALYTVNTSLGWGANNWTITPSGKVWEGLMGVGSYTVVGSDGKTLSQWTTKLDGASAPIVNPDGTITYTGYYGDYNIGGQSAYSNLSLVKGTTQYAANLLTPPNWSLWNATNSGSWGTTGNWTTGGVANSAGQTAYFGPTTGAKSINVDGAKTVGMIALDGSTGSYTIGGSAITLQGFNSTGGHLAAIYVASGNHEIDAPLTLADNTTVTVAPAASTLTITNLQSTTVSFSKSGAGTLAANNVQANSLNINAGTLKIIPNGTSNGTSNVASLSIAGVMGGWLAKLDLTNNSMVIPYTGATPLTTIQDQIKSGYAGGSWMGMGITTSNAASVASDGNNPNKTAIGFGEASTLGLGSFAGQSITGPAIVMRYTLFGDANLDGVVNSLDLNAIATDFGTAGTWAGGDFDYNSAVNINDFNALALNFNASLPASAPPLGALVPEPVAIVMLPTIWIFARRRER